MELPSRKSFSDYFIECSKRWADEAIRLMNRQALLNVLIFDMLEAMDPTTQRKFLLRFRAIDNRARSMYHGNKVEQPNNEQGNETTQDLPKNVSAVGEGFMGKT